MPTITESSLTEPPLTSEEKVFWHFYEGGMSGALGGGAAGARESTDIGSPGQGITISQDHCEEIKVIDKKTFITAAVAEGMTAYDALNLYYALDHNLDQHLSTYDFRSIQTKNHLPIILDTYRADPNKWRVSEINLGRPEGQAVPPLSGRAQAGQEQWYLHLSPYEDLATTGHRDDALASDCLQAGLALSATEADFFTAYDARLADLAGDDGKMDELVLSLHGLPGYGIPQRLGQGRLSIPVDQLLSHAAPHLRENGLIHLRSCAVGKGLLDEHPTPEVQTLKDQLLKIAHDNNVRLRLCTRVAWTGVYGSGDLVLITPDGTCGPDPFMAEKMKDYRAELNAELVTLGFAKAD